MERIKTYDYIALRKGKQKIVGLDKNDKPIFTQKQVDMLLGLDIAHISYNKLSERIMIFSYDTDIVPAIKVARMNGLQVIIPEISDIIPVPTDIKEHSDFIRKRKFVEIFS